jgi:aspartyl protease family protein
VTNVSSDQIGTMIYLLIFGGLAASTVMFLYRGRLGKALKDALTWLFIMVILTVGYAMREDLRYVGERTLSAVVPGYGVASADGKTMQFTAGPDGHFLIKGKVDGTPVVFVADTGATTVLLSYEDARKAGIDMEGLQFTSPVLTANGQAMAAPYRISEITLGDIRRANVIAMISQPDMVGTSLLGMSFLGRLSSFEVRGDQLTLHD